MDGVGGIFIAIGLWYLADKMVLSAKIIAGKEDASQSETNKS